MANVESLDADFVIENIELSGDEGVDGAENLPSEGLDFDSKPAIIPVVKVQKIGNSKRAKLTFEDLGIEVESIESSSLTDMLDKLYQDTKPLYVKNHRDIKVLIICSSALRALEIYKELKNIQNLMIIKLFAKHMKVAEQIKQLNEFPYLVGVGTATRISSIISTDADAIKLKRVEHLIIDSKYTDKKNQTILDLPETHLSLKELVSKFDGLPAKIWEY